ncbi:MAG: amidohydrolase [Bacteroidetes bacterium]|nr:amidohydrolase [Bacteroidota bacterium]
MVSILTASFFLSFSQTKDQLKETAAYSFEKYKQIHQYPELGKREFKTSELIKKELQTIGFTEFYEVPNLPTCIITGIDSKLEGTTIAFRAELDARPGKESTGLEYASKIDSTNHSCGHDAHASILLGTAKLIYSLKNKLKGKIYFIFQPAEETKGGADDIVNSGILNTLKIENIFALHSTSGLPVGKVNISPGYIMAGSNYFTIEIEGKESHAATPYVGSNIPVLTGKVIELITSIPSLKMDVSTRPCVISVTYVESGKTNAANIIPSTSVIKGTIRAYESVDSPFQNQPSIRNIISKEVEQLCLAQNAASKIEITKGSPPTINNNLLFDTTIPNLSKLFSGTIDTSPYRGMFSEDFSYYTENIPCLYFGLGIAKDKLGFANVHSNDFSVHPDTFIYGIELFCDIAMHK